MACVRLLTEAMTRSMVMERKAHSSSCLGRKLAQPGETHGVRCGRAQHLPTHVLQTACASCPTEQCSTLVLSMESKFMKGSESSLFNRNIYYFNSCLIFEKHCPEQSQDAGSPNPWQDSYETAMGGTILLNDLVEKNYFLYLERGSKTPSHAVASNQETIPSRRAILLCSSNFLQQGYQVPCISMACRINGTTTSRRTETISRAYKLE